MKRIYLLIVSVVMVAMANAQNVNVNPGAGSYPDLASAFAAINAGTHTGAITVDIVGNTTETVSAVLNASGVGSALYTSIVISPSGGTARTISGSIAGHLIDLNGADNVTIDGLNTGSNSLMIENTLSAATPTAIRFIADATSNTITNSTIRGAGTSATLGTVFFSTGTASGNDGNNINNCNINSSGANFATNAVYSLGTSAAIDNSGNTLNANNISDYFIATGSASIGVFLAATGNSTWTITNNRLFQTANRTYTSSQAGLCGISIQSGAGYTITGNIIGYANSAGTGTTNMLGMTTPGTFAGTFPSSYTIGTATFNATRYIALSCAFTAGGAVSSIQNNTIAGFALITSSGAATTNGIWCGINILSGNVDIGTTITNTIGATSGNGSIYTACTTAGGAIVGIYATSVNTVNIRNNTIGALDAMGTTATGNGGITGINSAGTLGNFDISGNTIGNSTDPNLRTGNLTTAGVLSNIGTTFGISSGTGTIRGILNSATGVITIGTPALPNTIRNASNNSSSTAAAFRGIDNSGGGTGGFSISSNTISNFTSQSANTTLGTGLLAGIGIYISTATGGLAGSSIILNTITGLSLTNTTATGTNVTGISVANYAVSILRNRICDIRNASTSVATLTPGSASGIFLRSATAGIPMNIANNMISLGNAQTTNTCFVGIWVQCGSTPNPIANIYYNTINIEGAVAAGAQPSFAVLRGSFVVTIAVGNVVPVDIRNNILNNTRAGGTGGHFAIANLYGTTTVTGGTLASNWGVNASNFNVLNAADPARIGNWTTDQTFAGWKTASASDANSLSAIPVTFISVCDLHLNMGVTPTQLESGVTAIAGITNDYDNDTRPGPAGSVNGGAVAPDFGADEFDGVPLDLVSPIISYTPLTFTCGLGNRTLVATITDPLSGVPIAGAGLPVLYWRINAGAYVPVTGTSLGANQYQFIFGAGVVLSDVVSYYIVAQDGAGTPNVGAFPSAGAGGFTANPPAAATPPTTPSSYTVNAVLAAGTYTVGGIGTYLTLTAAINDYNTRCLGGAIIFELLDPAYAEAGAMTIMKHPEASVVNTLTIRPAATIIADVSATVASGAILRILGDYVTIDGSNNGTSTRDLTLRNLSATAPTVVLIGSTGTSPITNVTLKNCIVINGAQTATAIVTSDAAVLGTAGYFNNITINNNDVRQAFIGSYSIAVVLAGNGTGLAITNNLLNTAGATSVRRVGIYVQGVDGATVSGNTIGNFETVSAESDYGIWFATGTVNSSATNNSISTLGMSGAGAFAPTGIFLSSNVAAANLTVTGNTISGLTSVGGGAGVSTNGIFFGFATTNATISQNNISNIKNTSATGWGANGILLGSSSTTASCTVTNNFVFDVAALGFAAASADDNGNGITVNAGGGYSIYNNTVLLNTNQTTAGGLPAAFLATAAVTAPGAINLRNNIFANTQTAGSTERYAIYSGAANTVFAAIDYNDYYTAGPNLGFIGSNRANLAAIQTGFGSNTNSQNVLPVFVSATDLHLSSAAGVNCRLDGFGTPIGTVTVDYDNAPRDAATPDIGADEFTSVPTSVLAATTGGGQVCSNAGVSLSGTTYKDATCNTIARILPNGGSPVSGMVNTCVTIDATVQTYGGFAYVQRHFDITPAVNQSTATATVTLYVLQSEFDTYNLNNGTDPDLPTGSGDVTGIMNLRVIKYSGNGTAPGNYVPGVATQINPNDADIVWDAVNSWWTITFDVTGFSGFYISGTFGALPVSLLNFSGYKDGSRNQLRWTTSSEQNNSGFEVQRSTDGINYSALGFVNTQALGGNSTIQLNYAFTDNNVIGSRQYYRLRQVNFDNSSKLSNIVLIKGDKPVTVMIDGLFPNPASTMVNVLIGAPNKEKLTMLVTDIAGRTVIQQSVNVETGSNTIPVDITTLANGTYMVKLVCSSNCESAVSKFVKQ